MKNDKIKLFISEVITFLSLLFSYPWKTFRWLWYHRHEPNNRAKRRRMKRDILKGLL